MEFSRGKEIKCEDDKSNLTEMLCTKILSFHQFTKYMKYTTADKGRYYYMLKQVMITPTLKSFIYTIIGKIEY